VVLAWPPLQGGAPGDRLLVQRIRRAVQGMWLAGTRGGLCTHHRLAPGQRQQVTFLSGVKDVAGCDCQLLAALQILEPDCCDPVAVHHRL
jgi:hypothetical protein